MKIFLISLMSLGSFSGISQSSDWKMSATMRYFPSVSFVYQQYSQDKKGGIIDYRAKLKQNGGIKKDRKSRKVMECDAFSAFSFVKSHLNDSIYHLELSSINLDSFDRVYLNENGLLTDSSIILNFNLFDRQWQKTVQTCEDCLPLIYFQSRQIDGERLILNMEEDSIKILDLNIGSIEAVPVKSFKQWILFAELYRKFELFEEVDLDAYFSNESVDEAMRQYIFVLQR